MLRVDYVAQALADPIRRQILLLLCQGSAVAGAIAERFPVSRPAVSRHLRVLREAGLVRDVPSGRERAYQLELSALAELEGYLKQLHAGVAWQRRFDALSTEVARVKSRRRRTRAESTPHSKRRDSA